MEVAEGGGPEERPPPPPTAQPAPADGEESKAPKRKMKSPYQLEVLEKTYAVEMYPSEDLRAELSAKLGLTDRQLQMWFCHRRLKDRKPPPAKRQRVEEDLSPPPMLPVPVPIGETTTSSVSLGVEPRKGVARAAVSRIGAEMSAAGRRYFEPMPAPSLLMAPQLSVAEMRVVASIEQQLGEPLRDDGPILGVEFDPLPPGAFGAPIAMVSQQKHPPRSYDAKIYERHDTKSIKASTFLSNMDHSLTPSPSVGKRKQPIGGVHAGHPQAGARALHEYQFLPEQPSIRSDSYERVPQSHFYDSSVEVPISSMPSLPSGEHFVHGNEQAATSYSFRNQMPSSSLPSQHGRQQILSSGSAEYDSVPFTNSYSTTVTDTQFGVNEVSGMENSFLSSDKRIFYEEDASKMDKRRKSEEARIAKEVEAHEKRIRKELEKQDILRRKKEEQMRKYMERHDRERRKEEERLMREKQREEERLLREQRREIERKEKFLQKETLRAEKMRQKEELRREKEAARQKAANERATARRIAREYMELVEDERLELMELAASSKGLSTIVSLDSDTLQQLDSFKHLLCAFPPKSVQLKRPFAISPWTESEENIGNLLMVWKFLVTFADILELWPFTLDEFVQALHDYDSRLLGEIHVALLKSIIKDIEDVARTPAIALGAYQNSTANSGGGHLQIVEGAYAWGFDIRSWQRHLNFLTWPEILRQFALSSGFGPKLKKRNVDRAYFHDDNEANDGVDVISNLRNGVAAENAVAWMHERGYSRRRRSRHRLTPGTVKFAAFHVLSLEGTKGLTILEVADRIQKSGLRDLTTSKTPEASIAAALSRDTKLFERTAPSTYCVRSPYRKDPADADAILSAAREKIQVFQNNLSDSEEAEKDAEDADEAERDEDSECDGADDPEIDDVAFDAKPNKNTPLVELKGTEASSSLPLHGMQIGDTPESGLKNVKKDVCLAPSVNSKATCNSGVINDELLDINSARHEESNADQEDTEIDESNPGEPWVQGLAEGEYSDLCVEERLNALVALIGVAIEGNSVRATLEGRLEAANALKKQMWAEAQLDRRRLKEDYISKSQYSSFAGLRAEPSSALERSQTPVHTSDYNPNDVNANSVDDDPALDPQNLNNLNNTSSEKNLLGQDFYTNTDPMQQCGYAAEKSRSQLKSYIGHRAEEIYVYRSLPLGQDRRRNRYWQFATSASPNDPGSGRIFIESKDGFWRLIDSEEAFDALVSALDTRGIRESHLHSMLQRIEPIFKESLRRKRNFTSSANPAEERIKNEATEITSDGNKEFDSPNSSICDLASDVLEHSSSFRIECGLNELDKSSALKRYQGFVKWLWKESYNPFILCAMKYGKKRCTELLHTCQLCYLSYFAEERHCSSCHRTFKIFHNSDSNFLEHVSQCEEKKKTDPDWKMLISDFTLPVRNRLLKALLALIEVSVPSEALQPFWTEGYRKSWGVKLHSSSSAEDLFQILTLLEIAMRRDCLSSKFEPTNELLSSCTPGFAAETTASLSGSVPVLPWVPNTTAAVALRLLDLDASIFYILDQKSESHKEKVAGEFIKLPSRYSVVKSGLDLEAMGTPEHIDYLMDGRWPDSGTGRRGRGRGGVRGRGGGRGRGRGRGGRGQRGILTPFRAEFKEGVANNIEKTTRKYTRRGRTRGRGRRRGQRSFRPRQISESRLPIIKVPRLTSFSDMRGRAKQYSLKESPRSLGEDRWGLSQSRRPYVEYDDNFVESESDDQGQPSGDEYEDQVSDYDGSKPIGLMDEESEEEDEAEEDGDVEGEEDLGYQVGPEDMDVVDDDEDEDMGDEDGDVGNEMANGDDDEDEGATSYSSEYSD